jgi:hypothetical protein
MELALLRMSILHGEVYWEKNVGSGQHSWELGEIRASHIKEAMSDKVALQKIVPMAHCRESESWCRNSGLQCKWAGGQRPRQGLCTVPEVNSCCPGWQPAFIAVAPRGCPLRTVNGTRAWGMPYGHCSKPSRPLPVSQSRDNREELQSTKCKIETNSSSTMGTFYFYFFGVLIVLQIQVRATIEHTYYKFI